jgi:hypothetical protein
MFREDVYSLPTEKDPVSRTDLEPIESHRSGDISERSLGLAVEFVSKEHESRYLNSLWPMRRREDR